MKENVDKRCGGCLSADSFHHVWPIYRRRAQLQEHVPRRQSVSARLEQSMMWSIWSPSRTTVTMNQDEFSQRIMKLSHILTAPSFAATIILYWRGGVDAARLQDLSPTCFLVLLHHCFSSSLSRYIFQTLGRKRHKSQCAATHLSNK